MAFNQSFTFTKSDTLIDFHVIWLCISSKNFVEMFVISTLLFPYKKRSLKLRVISRRFIQKAVFALFSN